MMGKRSAAIEFILAVLKSAGSEMTLDELRAAMFYLRHSKNHSISPPHILRETRLRWVVLQVRQAQRLGLEALLSWVERQVLTGNTTPERIVTSAVKSLTAKGGPLDGAASLGEMVSGFLEGVNGLDSFVNTAFSHSLYCLFSQMRLLESELAEQPDLIVPRSLIILIICAKLGEWLNGLVKPSLLGHGGADRISLGYWRETVAKCGRMPIKSALEYVLTYLIVSQHFSVATRRFDGRTQRLRITVEEEGLVSLAGNYWQPSVTDDKLYSAVSLMSECGLVRFDRDDERVWVEN